MLLFSFPFYYLDASHLHSIPLKQLVPTTHSIRKMECFTCTVFTYKRKKLWLFKCHLQTASKRRNGRNHSEYATKQHSISLVNATLKAAKLLVSLDRINRPFVCTHKGTRYSTLALLVAEACACMRLYRNRDTTENTELTTCQYQILAQMHWRTPAQSQSLQ